jgi:divalent metal cation (Fe/Co/Zn/Cd) transporter
MGGLFDLRGWHRLHEAERSIEGVVALPFSPIVRLESASLIGCLREIRKVRRGRPFRDWLKHTRNAELVVVLGEDIAAEIGLVPAFVFVAAADWTGDTRWDAAGSIAIGVVLIIVAFFIALRVKGLLVGRSAEPELERRLDELIADDDAIEEVLNTLTIKFGPQVVATKIRMKPGLSIDEAVERINRLERQIKERFPEIGWCFVEPDTAD